MLPQAPGLGSLFARGIGAERLAATRSAMETRMAGSVLVGREGLGVVEGLMRQPELALPEDWAAASSSCMFRSDTRFVLVKGVRQVPGWGTGVAGPGLGLSRGRGFSSSPARKTDRAPCPPSTVPQN